MNICNICGKTEREQMKGCNEITCYRGLPLPTNEPSSDEEVKEKAKELVDRFSIELTKWYGHSVVAPKQCALISIEREIDLVNRLLETGLNNDFDLMMERAELKSIKSEIVKM